MSLTASFFIMFFSIWFGGTFIYFVRYLDKNNSYSISTLNIILSFLENLKNIALFYKTFINSYPIKNRRLAFFLLLTHIASPIFFWIIVITEAIKSGNLSFY